MTPEQLDAYFKRIGIPAIHVLDAPALSRLQRAHLARIPFENLDILAGRGPVNLEPKALFDKLVMRRRGGICYEQNALFADVLRTLGARVAYKAGRVYEGGSVFDHIFLLVELPDASDRQWLCDVGFAYLLRGPLRMELDVVQPGGPESYLIEAAPGEDEGRLRVVRIRRDATRESLFSFGPQVYELSDFHERVVFNSTDPSTRFTKGPLVCIDAGEGRTVLSYSRLSWLEEGKVASRTIDPDEVDDVLREVFGLVR